MSEHHIEAGAGLSIQAADLPVERFTDPTFGAVSWQTLFCADRTDTRALTCGLAHLEPGACLAPHTHAPEEVYFGVSGRAVVYIDGVPHVLTPGVAVYIPAYALHGVFAQDEEAQFFYVFPRDSFAEVDYNFLPAAQPAPAQMPLGTAMPMPGAQPEEAETWTPADLDLDTDHAAEIAQLSQFDSDDASVQ